MMTEYTRNRVDVTASDGEVLKSLEIIPEYEGQCEIVLSAVARQQAASFRRCGYDALVDLVSDDLHRVHVKDKHGNHWTVSVKLTVDIVTKAALQLM